MATSLQWGALLVILLPKQIRAMDPENYAATQGILLGLGALFALVAPLLVGALSDRCASRWGRRRPYMVAGTVVNLAGIAVMFFAGEARAFAWYTVGFLLIQLGNNSAAGAYSGTIPDLVPVSQRGEASGYMALMQQLGTIIGLLATGLLVDRGMTFAAYFGMFVANVVLLAVTCVAMRESPLADRPEPINWAKFVRGLWIDPRKHPDFFWVWITRFLVTLGIYAFQPNFQFYLTDVNGVAPSVAGKMTAYLGAIILVGAIVSGIVGGRISDRIGRKRVVYFANGVMFATSIAFMFSGSVPITFAVGLVYGLGYGAYLSVDWALGCDVLPNKDEAAKDMGVWHVSMTLPQSVAAPIAGALLGLFGRTVSMVDGEKVYHYAHSGYSAVLGFSALSLLCGALLLRNVRGVK